MTLVVAIAAEAFCCIAASRTPPAEEDGAATTAAAQGRVWAHRSLPLLVGIAGLAVLKDEAGSDLSVQALLDASLGQLSQVPQQQRDLVDVVRPALIRGAEHTARALGAARGDAIDVTLVTVGHVPGGMPMFGVVRVGATGVDAATFDVVSHFARSRNSAVLGAAPSVKQSQEYLDTIRLSSKPRELVPGVVEKLFLAALAEAPPQGGPPKAGVHWDLEIRPEDQPG